jgi:hypothetical protein
LTALRPSSTAPKVNPEEKTRQERTRFQAAQQQNIRQLNLDNSTRFGTFAAGPVTSAALAVKPLTTAAQASMRAFQGEGSGAYISGHTIPARIGHRINVGGVGFGASPGRVVVLINRQLVECPVHRWGDREISVTLPLELAVAMGPSSTSGTVWVKLAGGEIGPTAPIRLETLALRVTSITPPQGWPGQQFLIQGENFLPRRSFAGGQGSVSYRFASGLSGEMDVLRWREDAVLVQLPDSLTGLVGQPVTVTVTNAAGVSAPCSFTFRPFLDYETLTIGGFGINNTRYDCNYCDALWEDIFSSISSFFTNLVGERVEYVAFEGQTLQNQWEVVSAYLTIRGGGAGHGANILAAPAAGSSRPQVRFEYWADGFAWVGVRVHVDIQGPRGLPCGSTFCANHRQAD